MTIEQFTTPSGGTVRMHTRPGTNDHNVCYSVITEDEYQLDRVKPLTGTALDVGAHIGAATVALLEMNPDLRVIAIEPIPENVELLRENVAPYGDRATIIEAAAGKSGKIRWNGPDEVHRFIGNQHGTGGESLTAETVTLSQLVKEYGPISFLKIDCEGCEDSFLDDPAIDQVERIAAEYHNGGTVRCGFEKPAPKKKRATRKRKAVK